MFIIYCLLFGVFMKLADLVNEHRLKASPNIKLLLGIIWGILLCLISTYNIYIYYAWAGILIAYIIRGCIDYPNHIIATILFFILMPMYYGIQLNLLYVTIIFAIVNVFLAKTVKVKVKNNKDYFLFGLLLYCAFPLSFFLLFRQIEFIFLIPFFSYKITYFATKLVCEKKFQLD